MAELVQAIRELTGAVQQHDTRFERVKRERAELRSAVQELVATSKQQESRLTRIAALSAEHTQRRALQEEHTEQLERGTEELRVALAQLSEAVAQLVRKTTELDRKLDRFSPLSITSATQLSTVLTSLRPRDGPSWNGRAQSP